MDTSRRKLLALFGLGSAALVSGSSADLGTEITKPVDAVAQERRQNALAFVKSVNSDLLRYGHPPLDDGYVSRALGRVSPIFMT
jgi:hypothetical protein